MMAGKRVLVVDDEFMVAAMLIDTLEDIGAVPIGPASTVAEALGLVTANTLDAAILDWNLNGEAGTPIARALNERRVPYLISTGYGSVADEFAAIPRLTKPYTPPTLLAELEKLLRPLPPHFTAQALPG